MRLSRVALCSRREMHRFAGLTLSDAPKALTTTRAGDCSTTVISTNPSKPLMAEHLPKSPDAATLTSATESPLPEEAVGLYRDVLLAMNEHQIPYAVAGAFALQKYTGIWRVTKDLDLFLNMAHVPAAL